MSTLALPRITLAVNPTSGRGRAERLLPRVLDQLRTALPGVQLDVHRSESYDHALALCSDAVAQDTGALLVMGGDGMAHAGLNACAGTDVPLGVIPAGTGNDFCRGAGLPRLVGPSVKAIIAGRTRRIDLTRVEGPDGGVRHVGSIVSTGYDARVNLRTNNLPTLPLGPFVPLAYAGVALSELASYRPMAYRLEVDGVPRTLEAMFVAIANAGFFGGGMQVAPGADVTDGLLDVVVAHPMGRGVLLRLLPKIFSGAHIGHPRVEVFQARSVRVDGDATFAMGDGEPLGGVPLLATCEPGSLLLLTP